MDSRFGPHGGDEGHPPQAGDREHEEAILRRARAGDIKALEWLVEHKRERAFRLARYVVGDDDDAKDVVQLAFIRVWRTIRRHREGSGFDPWFHRIVMNLAIDFRRRAAARRRGLHDMELVSRVPVASETAEGVPGAIRREEVGRIFDELAGELPARQRAVFALREIEGLETEEVARMLELRASTVRNHLFQARRTLQRVMRSRYPEYLPARRDPESGE